MSSARWQTPTSSAATTIAARSSATPTSPGSGSPPSRALTRPCARVGSIAAAWVTTVPGACSVALRPSATITTASGVAPGTTASRPSRAVATAPRWRPVARPSSQCSC